MGLHNSTSPQTTFPSLSPSTPTNKSNMTGALISSSVKEPTRSLSTDVAHRSTAPDPRKSFLKDSKEKTIARPDKESKKKEVVAHSDKDSKKKESVHSDKDPKKGVARPSKDSKEKVVVRPTKDSKEKTKKEEPKSRSVTTPKPRSAKAKPDLEEERAKRVSSSDKARAQARRRAIQSARAESDNSSDASSSDSDGDEGEVGVRRGSLLASSRARALVAESTPPPPYDPSIMETMTFPVAAINRILAHINENREAVFGANMSKYHRIRRTQSSMRAILAAMVRNAASLIVVASMSSNNSTLRPSDIASAEIQLRSGIAPALASYAFGNINFDALALGGRVTKEHDDFKTEAEYEEARRVRLEEENRARGVVKRVRVRKSKKVVDEATHEDPTDGGDLSDDVDGRDNEASESESESEADDASGGDEDDVSTPTLDDDDMF